MNKMPWKKIFLVAALMVVAVVILVPGGMAHAQTTPAVATQTPTNPYSCSVTSGLPTCILFLLFYVINAILSLGVALGIWLVGVFLTLNGQVFDSPTVQTGFGVTLGLANLGFVLGVIVIAIATILRNQTYGIKQILWKLILIAIFVNFGLVITKPIVAFSDTLTNYFKTAIGGNSNTDFAMNLANAFRQQQLMPAPLSPADQAIAKQIYNTNCHQLSGYWNFITPIGRAAYNALNPDTNPNCDALYNLANGKAASDDFLSNLITLLFSAIFTCILVFTLLALAILLIVRYVHLALLLILLPFAWLAWIFPKFSSHFSKWCDDFINWTFFPAIAMFFIYLALLTAGLGAQNQNYLQIAAPATQGTDIKKDPATAILEMASTKNQVMNPSQLQVALDVTVICGLMLGGLFAAASLAGKAGQMAVSTGKSTSNAIGKYAGRKTKAGARSVGNNVGDRMRSAGKQYDPRTRETTTWLQRRGSQLQNVPGLRRVGVGMANVGAPEAIKKGREKDVQDYVDNNLKSLTNEGVIARATSKTAFVNPTQSAAIAQELAKRNLTTHKDVAPLMDKYVNAVDRVGNLEKVTSNRPDLMPQRKDPKTGAFIETKAEAIERAIKGAKGDIIQTNAETFNPTPATPGGTTNKSGMNSDEVEAAVLALSPAQLSAIGSDLTAGNQDKQNNITDVIKGMVNRAGLTKPALNAVGVPTGKFELDSAKLKAMLARPRVSPRTRQQLENLEKVVKKMENDNNWGSVLGN